MKKTTYFSGNTLTFVEKIMKNVENTPKTQTNVVLFTSIYATSCELAFIEYNWWNSTPRSSNKVTVLGNWKSWPYKYKKMVSSAI